MKTVISFDFAFENEYNEKFVATRILDLVIHTMGPDFLTGMSALSYYK